MKRALVWLRRDLRLNDHAPLAAATSCAEQVAVAFVFDRVILDALEDRDDRRVSLIAANLRELDTKLRDLGSCLIVRYGDPVLEIPKLAKSLNVGTVFAGRDYEPYAVERDARVASQVQLELIKDHVVLEAGEIGKAYSVFTPFFRAWQQAIDPLRDLQEQTPDLSRLMPRRELPSSDGSFEQIGFQKTELLHEPGEAAAGVRLRVFASKLANYGHDRDFPALNATSGLSPDLRFGTISIRECVRLAWASGVQPNRWLAELAWREFYQAILQNRPSVAVTTFQPQYQSLEWVGNLAHFDAWAQGRTGVPIVDAAMRCLNATGWMHNRLRMVTASFLTKDLLLDYRLGEAYFARKLLDFDLASNNGGWQWAASVGCDAQPYFRIFNPYLQSQKFDPEGVFLRRWLPELAELEGKALHDPSLASPAELAMAGVELGKDYPSPLVDHRVQKELALKMFRSSTKAGPDGIY